MQIYLDEVASPLEEDSNYHVLEVVAYMELGCDHSQDLLLHHLEHGLEVDPSTGVMAEATYDPSGELAFAYSSTVELIKRRVHKRNSETLGKQKIKLAFEVWDDATINQKLSEV